MKPRDKPDERVQGIVNFLAEQDIMGKDVEGLGMIILS